MTLFCEILETRRIFIGLCCTNVPMITIYYIFILFKFNLFRIGNAILLYGMCAFECVSGNGG